jgi:hypothetical protein
MGEPDAETAMCNDFAKGCRDGETGFGSACWGYGLGLVVEGSCGRGGRSQRDVEIALDELKIGGEATEECVYGGGGQVA